MCPCWIKLWICFTNNLLNGSVYIYIGLQLEKRYVLTSTAVETRSFLMFIHVYFLCLWVDMRRWLVHVLPELMHYTNQSRHITKPQNGIFCFLKKWPNLKAETWFYTKSNLLYLACRHVVSILIAPQCLFNCARTWECYEHSLQIAIKRAGLCMSWC